MVDVVLILLIVGAVYWGAQNHSPKLTPYFTSLVVGFIFATVLHTHFSKYIYSNTDLDFAFSSIFSFAILLLLGAMTFYGCLIAYHHYDSEQSVKLYSKFSNINFISLPLLVLIVFCSVALVVAELPLKSSRFSSVQRNISSSTSIHFFRNFVQQAGIDPKIVSNVGHVPLSQNETSEEVVPLAFKSTQIDYDQSLELEMTKLINIERSKAGIKPLDYTNQLSEVARRHSIDMLEKRYFAHTNLDGESPFDRLHKGNISYTIAGENLAISTSLEGAVSALMKSPTHKANILNEKFHKTGVGIAKNQDGIMAITEEFSN